MGPQDSSSSCTVTPRREDLSSLELDALYRALSHPVRRLTLFFLTDQSGPVDFDDLLAFLVGSDYLTLEAEELRITLTHQHLPQLADAGLIDYDGPGGPIRYNTYPAVEAHLALIEDHVED